MEREAVCASVDVSVTPVRQEDQPKATITPYRDGPYLVRGSFVLCDQDGLEIPLGRRTIALCRCGKSRTRPFCDGTHRLTGFEASSGAEEWPVVEAPPTVP
jgi:CDGSH-type Zn-finger protein